MGSSTLRYVTVLLVVALGGLFGPVKGGDGTEQIVSMQIARALDDVAGGINAPGDSALYALGQSAFHRLSKLRANQVVPAIVDALQSDERFSERSARRGLYRILAHHQGEKTALGREQLLSGLTEHDLWIPVICAQGIANASDKIRSEAVNRLSKQWDESIARFGYPSRPIVQALGRLGGSAQRFLERLQPVFVNAELDKDLRIELAHAMVRIGGIEYVLEYLGNHDLDPADEWLVVAAVASGVHKAKETDEMPPVMRQKLLHLVLKHMRNEHKDIREQALQVLLFLLWDKVDVFIIRAPNDYELNPIVREAIDHMAANDPDEVLRRMAAGTLEQMDLDKVERILRSRQQKQETKPQGDE